MKKSSMLAFVFTLVFGLLLAACGGGNDGGSGSEGDGGSDNGGGDYQTNLSMGSGSTGGVYYPFSGELGTMWTDNIDVDGLDVSVNASGGSVENVAKTASGEFQLSLAQNNTTADAINGTGSFEGKESADNIGVIASLFPEALQVVTLESTGIDSIEELEGKNVAVGPPGGGTYRASQLLMEAYGIGEDDYTPYEEGFADAKDKLQNGTIDAIIYVVGIPSATADELQAATGEVKFLDLNDKAVQMFEEEYAYEAYEMAAGTYDWQEEPLKTVAAQALLIANTDQVSEDLGYQLTKTLFENSGDMAISQAQLVSKDAAFEGVNDLPLHPGAQQYYEEEGMMENYEGGQ